MVRALKHLSVISGEKVIEWLVFFTAVYHIVMVMRIPEYLGVSVPILWQRSVSLSLIVLLLYLTRSISGKSREGKLPWYDLLFLTGGLAAAGFPLLFFDRMLSYWDYGRLDLLGIVLAVVLAIVLLEASRRIVGWALPIIILVFMLITLFQNYMPGVLFGPGFPLPRLTFSIFGTEGILGMPLGIATTIVISFLIFSALMLASGAGEWFSELAIALVGWSKGGIAKASVVASSFFATITGSPGGNVAVTGSITIPLMVRHGYTPTFAGAVEAVASTGGPIMPPIMGAIIFIMAEWIEVSYYQIALAAALPASLYFLIAFMSIHFEAHRSNLASYPRSELPNIFSVLKKGWYFIVPLYTLVHFLFIFRWPPQMACLVAIGLVVVCSFFGKKENRMYPLQLFRGLAKGVRLWLIPAPILATVGMLLATLQLSGLGLTLTRVLINLSGGHLIIALLMIAIAAYILGMGLDATPLYVTLVILVGPVLIKLGVPPMAAHLYVIYWGISSFLTPPLCIAVFIACGLSGANVWKTGWQAMRLSAAIFVVPIMFAFDQALLLQGPVDKIVIAAITAFIGATSLAAGIRGYGLKPMSLLQRILAIGGGIALLWPGLSISLAGLTVLAVLVVWQIGFNRFNAMWKRPTN